MEEAPLYVKFLMYLFVVVYMLSVMLETTHGEIVTMLKDRHRMGLALLANLVVVPILSFVLVRLLDLRPEIRIGVMMLAISPGACDRPLCIGDLDHAAGGPLAFSQGGCGSRAVRMDRLFIPFACGSAAVGRAGIAKAISRTRAEARPLVRSIVDRDLHYSSAAKRQIQEPCDQSAGHRRHRGYRRPDRCLLGRWLDAGRA